MRSSNYKLQTEKARKFIVIKSSEILSICFFLYVFTLVGCGADLQRPAAVEKAHNIILFIGDGMGEQHRLAAKMSAFGEEGHLAMDDMPIRGYAKTKSAGNKVTDSAAAATSIASGIKTINKVIGMNQNLKIVPTILEEAQKSGKRVGLVTTTQTTHATPAAFAAHVDDRNKMVEIASQMLDEKVDVLMGGGEDEFLPSTETGCYPEPGERDDGRNLISEAIKAGYKFVCNREGLLEIEKSNNDKLLGLFADEGMTRPFSPTLAEMTKIAIDILSKSPNGFFIMIEGGQIDWASHDNDAVNSISDTIGLDQAVEVAKKFALLNKDTLIIVTSDHETGGLKVDGSENKTLKNVQTFRRPDGQKFYIGWSTTHHTDSDVPVTASGPSSELLKGIYQNTHIFEAMNEALVGHAD